MFDISLINDFKEFKSYFQDIFFDKIGLSVSLEGKTFVMKISVNYKGKDYTYGQRYTLNELTQNKLSQKLWGMFVASAAFSINSQIKILEKQCQKN